MSLKSAETNCSQLTEKFIIIPFVTIKSLAILIKDFHKISFQKFNNAALKYFCVANPM